MDASTSDIGTFLNRAEKSVSSVFPCFWEAAGLRSFAFFRFCAGIADWGAVDGGGKTSASASLGGGCRLGMREKGWKVSAKESYSLIGDRVPKLIGERIKPRPEHDVGECDGYETGTFSEQYNCKRSAIGGRSATIIVI